MMQLEIRVGHYYELRLHDGHIIVFAVLYGFERGKNKGVYTLRLFDGKKDVEFPIEESTFHQWAMEGRIKEIPAEDALRYALHKHK